MRTLIKLFTIGSLIQSGYSQIQFNFGFRDVVKTNDSHNPSWAVATNPGHGFSVGTHQSNDLLPNQPFFTSYLFNSTVPMDSIPRYQQPAVENCSIEADTLKALFPTPTDVFYIYALAGEMCAEKGLLKITHLDVTENQIREVKTITASGFASPVEMNDPKMWDVLPPSNFGKPDVVSIEFIEASNLLSVYRTAVTLKENKVPLQLNIPRGLYDFSLTPQGFTSEYHDLSNVPNNTLVQFQYTPPYLAVGTLSVGSKIVKVEIRAPGQSTKMVQVELPKKDDDLFYHMSLHPYNASAFLLYSQILNPELDPLRYLFLLHLIFNDGKKVFLGSRPTTGVDALVVLRESHGPFLKDGVFSIENALYLANPNLTYFYPEQTPRSYLMPDFPRWIYAGLGDNPALVEGQNSLQLVEMQVKDDGYHLGSYEVFWQKPRKTTTSTTQPTTTPQPTPTPIETSSPSTTAKPLSISTTSSSFFQNATAMDKSETINRGLLAIGITAGFLLLALSGVSALCLTMFCKKKSHPYRALEDDKIYKV